MKKALLMVFVLLMSVAVTSAQEMTITAVGAYKTGVFDEGAAEIVSYDATNQNVYIVNSNDVTLDIVNISDPSTPELVNSIDMTEFGAGANSVYAWDEWVAVAIEGEEVDSNGSVLFLTLEGEVITSVEVGVLPDMVTVSADGQYVLTANEGEPNDDYSIDPEGSVSIINTADNFSVMTATFGDMMMEDMGDVRVFGPEANVAQDLEPEYIALSPDGTKAYVVLQENNALAVVDVASATVDAVVALGFKDYSLEENGIDASNEDGEINIRAWDNVFGMYQPDGIATYEAMGEVYVVSANEGDARDYDTFSEEARVADVTLDPDAFPNAEELQAEDQLGRLLITTTLGDTDGDGDYDELYNYGARSFSIWNSAGELVWDSGNDFETITAELIPDAFNSQGSVQSFDNRSDDKGPEPENVAIGNINGNTYAFIILERVGGIMVYNISDPMAPEFVTYYNHNDISVEITEDNVVGFVAPEGIVFISADESPTGNPMLVVGYEVSGSTGIYEITME